MVQKIDNEDYATPNRLAMYLEIGWSDFLLPRHLTSRSSQSPAWPDPKLDAVRPDFYRKVADLCRHWCTGSLASICDVGAATGRLSYELAHRFPGLSQVVAVEPSIGFSRWASMLLLGDDQLPPVPQLGPVGRETISYEVRRPVSLTQSTSAAVSVVTATAEEFASRGDVYDLVTCLNVVDRHPEPGRLVAALTQLVKADGILVCSSPLDFQQKWTAENGAWIDNLNGLFQPSVWTDIGESEAYYEFRYYDRVWTRFNCQIVCKRKRQT